MKANPDEKAVTAVEDMTIPFGVFIIFLLAGLTFTVIYDTYIQKKHRTYMMMIIGLCAALLVQNYLEDSLSVGEVRVLARTTTSVIGYIIRPLVITLFLHIVAPKWKHRGAWILNGINVVAHLTAFFSHIVFWINEENHFQRGPLSYTCLVISLLLLVYLFWLTIHEYHSAPLREMVIPILIVVMVFMSIWLDGQVGGSRQPVTFLTVGMVVSCVFYYTWLHMQFVREHEEDLKARQRIQIMMSQIRPHFLYNTLSSIQALCHSEPEKAAEVTGQFSVYLRENLDFMEQTGLVPFWKELDHTKTYVKIEETRFPNIRVDYGIKDSAFSLPPLTLQPIVENAIRHGVRIRSEGVVQVMTRLNENMHEIVVRDNGTGFDPSKIWEQPSDHIGLRNVRDRIESMCGGTVTVESVMDEGTTVTIQIPVQDADRQETTNKVRSA